MALEITSREELEAWLEDKPHEWVEVIAARSALRVLPLAVDPDNSVASGKLPEVTLAALRAIGLQSATLHLQSVEAKRAVSKAANSFDIIYARSDDAYFNADNAANAYAARAAYFAAAGSGFGGLVYFIHASNDAAEAAIDADVFWQAIDSDCQALEDGAAPSRLLLIKLWSGGLKWWNDVWDNVRRWLSRPDCGFKIWREWYYGRLEGLPHAFANFDDAADAAFYQWLVEKDDDWWEREPFEVNAEIKELVDGLRKPAVPSDEELEQNPRAFTFSLDSEGRTELDDDVLPNGLQGDADERDNHSEILRLIENAVLATAGDTNAKDMAEPTDLLKEALGETVETLRPRIFVLRAREIIRQVNERESGASMKPQLSERQRDAYLPLVAALQMIAEFSPKLAQLWHGKLGQTGEPLTREMLDLIAKAFRNSRQTTELAQAIIEASNAQVAPDAPEDDPARIAASETSRNVVRKMGGAVKKAGDGARSIENIAKLTDRAIQIAGYLKGRLPDGETIARILQMFGGG